MLGVKVQAIYVWLPAAESLMQHAACRIVDLLHNLGRSDQEHQLGQAQEHMLDALQLLYDTGSCLLAEN